MSPIELSWTAKKTSQAWASTHPITSGCAETGWLIHKGIRHGQVVLFQPLFLKLTHKHFFRVLSAPLGPFKKKRKGNQPLIFWKFLFPSSSRFLAIWGLCHFASISTLNFGPWLTKLGGAVGAIQKWHTMTMDLVPAGITEKRPFLHSTKKHFFGTKSVFFLQKITLSLLKDWYLFGKRVLFYCTTMPRRGQNMVSLKKWILFLGQKLGFRPKNLFFLLYHPKFQRRNEQMQPLPHIFKLTL